MTSTLSAVPVSRRRRAALAAGALAVLLVVVGLLPWTVPAPATLRLLSSLAVLAGLLAGTMAWGVARSIRLDTREAALDAAVSSMAGGCDCGHDHDADELTVQPPAAQSTACASGGTCTHSCETCVLAARRS